MQLVQPPMIEVVGEMIRNHSGTISLGQGVVHYPPPEQALDQLSSFLSDQKNHLYQAFQGLPSLLDALTAKLRAENGIAIDERNQVIVTAGGNMAFMNAVLAITDPGDEIILQLPYYFNHEMAITMADCKAVLVATDRNYQLQPAAIREAITDRTRAVVTISPNNPTGAVYPEAALREVNRICREHGIYHISDEAYEYFTYGVNHFSPASIAGSSEHTISLYSLSKAYGFASWRIGYMVVPAALVPQIKKIQDTILICPPVISQFAAVGALQAGSDYCRHRLPQFAEVREMVMNELDAISDFCFAAPADGAFYFLLRLDTTLDPLELVKRLVREHGVAAIPGSTFGLNDGCYLRIAYGALQKETVAEGMGRLTRGLRTILKG